MRPMSESDYPSSKTASEAIRVAGLRHRFGSHLALNDVCFQIPRGAICGLVGPNGSGKTTLLRILLGLIRPQAGTAHVLGTAITQPQAYLGRVGALVETPAFYPELSGHDNLRIFARLRGIHPAATDEVLQQVGLSGQASRPAGTYSLGMKQRLGLAIALLPKPDLLILDEPTNGLDPLGVTDLRSLLRQQAQQGVTILVSSHLLTEIAHICDHIVLMQAGKVLFQDSLQQLYQATGSQLVLEPESTSDLNFLKELMAQLGLRAQVRDQQVIVDAERHQGALINRAAAAMGVTLNTLELRQRSLEASFFELLNKEEIC